MENCNCSVKSNITFAICEHGKTIVNGIVVVGDQFLNLERKKDMVDKFEKDIMPDNLKEYYETKIKNSKSRIIRSFFRQKLKELK